ncbi:MAG: transposase [Syntrophaceae bacterium]|nr:transposase [Syntrophaceae bacterium]
MTRPLRIQYPNAYYHITCRGNERKEIFRDKDDYNEFFAMLARSVDIFDVHLVAYACMPNHFHLLVRTPRANLSEFMRHFNISYTGSFNRKYRRSGHLYQGRYKAYLIDADNYLLEVSRYVHLNPLRMKSKEPLKKRWQDLLQNDSTSFSGYINQGKRKEFVNYTMVMDYFGGDSQKSRNEYKEFVAEGMHKEMQSPLDQGKGSGIIGKDVFVGEIRKLFGKKNKAVREQPALRELGMTMTPEELIEKYSKIVDMKREDLTTKGKQSMERAMLMEFLYRFCNITQPEIGRLLGGIDYSAVSQSRKRMQLKIQKEKEWERKFNQIRIKLCQMSRVKI